MKMKNIFFCIILLLILTITVKSQVYINTNKKSNDTINQIIKNQINELLYGNVTLMYIKNKFLMKYTNSDTNNLSQYIIQLTRKCQNILNNFKNKDSICFFYDIETDILFKNYYNLNCKIFYPLFEKDNMFYMKLRITNNEILVGYIDLVKYESPLTNCDGN